MVATRRLAAPLWLVVVLLWPCASEARYLTDLARAQHVARTDPFELGRVITNPQTLEVEDLQELFRRTAGEVNVSEYLSFEEYWAASRNSRIGKGFEAIEDR